MTAMTAATLDTLSGGRFRLGLGVSGPQVSEGWHGVRFDKPLGRTREYVDIVQDGAARETVRLRRRALDAAAARRSREGAPAHRPPGPRPPCPIYLAAVGPKNLELAGEVADGWLAIFFAPESAGESPRHIRPGREVRARPWPVSTSCPRCLWCSVTTSGVRRCRSAPTPRSTSAAWAAGEQELLQRPRRTHGLRGGGRRDPGPLPGQDYAGAAAAVPQELIDQTSLIGPVARVSDRLAAYAEAGVTTLSVATYHGSVDERIETLRSMVEALEMAGLAYVISWVEAVVLGLVQGLTEFLPISSSTAHLRIVPRVRRLGGPGRGLHGGHPARDDGRRAHLLPQDLWRIACALVAACAGPSCAARSTRGSGWYIIVGTIPIAVFGPGLQGPDRDRRARPQADRRRR